MDRLPIDRDLLGGTPRRVRRVSSSPRSRVWTAEVGGTPVVVKQVVGEPDATSRFERERTALHLAARAEPPVAPQVLAVDEPRHVLVLERLPTQKRALPPWVAYAEGLARLHQVTDSDDVGALPTAAGPTDDDLDAFARLCAAFDLAAPLAELESLPARLTGGHDLLHGDPCSGNALAVDGRARFIDFEHASLGSGLAELAYLRIGFPTCWNCNVVPDADLAEAESAYRSLHPQVVGSLADHCVGWLLRSDALVERAHRDRGRDHFAALLREDWTWGFVGARQRLAHRLAVVARLDEPQLAATSAIAATLRERMVRQWPECGKTPDRAARIAT